MKYLALCPTTSATLQFRKRLHGLNIPVETIPVPRSLSASCGIALIFECHSDLPLSPADNVSKIYSMTGDQYSLIYETK